MIKHMVALGFAVFISIFSILSDVVSAAEVKLTVNGSNHSWHAGLNHLVVDGKDRTFILDIPKALQPNPALVLVFHGYYDSAESVRKYSGLPAAAEKNGFFAVYPEGTLDHENNHYFNVGYEDNTPEERQVNDIKFIHELVTILIRDLRIDPNAVFATGMSNGADMSYLLACQTNPIVSAIAPVAGTMMTAWQCHPNKRVSVMEIHGTQDDTTPWAGDPDNRDGQGSYLGTMGVMDFWVKSLGLENTTVKQKGIVKVNKKRSGSLVVHQWSTTKDTAEVILYEVQGGKHDWPLSFGQEGVPTAEVIWSFLSKHRSISHREK